MAEKRFLRAMGRRAWRWTLRGAVLVAAILVTIPLVFAFQARWRHPDLKPWHRLRPAGELRAGPEAQAMTFAAYRQLEDRLLGDVRQKILESSTAPDHCPLSRYHAGSIPARLAFEQVYNRSFELVPEEARGAVLLVHGLSDSPYSLRAIAEALFAHGFYVLVLRLPGHGTVPAALLDVSWRDWQAAVSIGARHAAARVPPGKPFYAGGFSTGAALVLLYALEVLESGASRPPDRLFLFSPAIGISRFAVLTTLVSRLSFLPYFEKSAWIDVLPEYDPFKYNSFPVNAATQIYQLTRELEARLAAAHAARQLERLPRVLAFQSLVDATVSAADVVNRLFLRLPTAGHELVVFDLHRSDQLRDLIAEGPRRAFDAMVGAPALPFRLTLIGNRAADTAEVASYSRAAGSRETVATDLGLSWPHGVLSLTHVAIPFPPDDPLYGLSPAADWGLPLGRLAARGEAGAMVISLATLARLRSNPFFEVIRTKIRETVASDLGP